MSDTNETEVDPYAGWPSQLIGALTAAGAQAGMRGLARLEHLGGTQFRVVPLTSPGVRPVEVNLPQARFFLG